MAIAGTWMYQAQWGVILGGSAPPLLTPLILNAPHMIPKVNRSNATRQGLWVVFHRGKGQPSNYHQVYPLLWQVSFPKFRASRSLSWRRETGWVVLKAPKALHVPPFKTQK